MKGLIVAGVAGIAGVAGVVGLSSAATGGGGDDPTPSPPAVTSTAPAAAAAPSLERRLAEVRRAERAADRALGRSAPAAPAVTTSGRTLTAPRSGDDDGTLDQGPGDRDPVTGALLDDDHRDGHLRGRDRDDDGDDDHRGRGRDDDHDDDSGHGRGHGRGGDDDD